MLTSISLSCFTTLYHWFPYFYAIICLSIERRKKMRLLSIPTTIIFCPPSPWTPHIQSNSKKNFVSGARIMPCTVVIHFAFKEMQESVFFRHLHWIWKRKEGRTVRYIRIKDVSLFYSVPFSCLEQWSVIWLYSGVIGESNSLLYCSHYFLRMIV